jgi:hypothetical protein
MILPVRDRRRPWRARQPEFAPPYNLYGCFMGVWREDLERVNGFDMRFVGWGEEDVDIAVRLRRGGVRCGWPGPGATLLHLWHPDRVRTSNMPLLRETQAGERIEAVERAVEGAPRPRVAALEWLDPLYVGGHWVPQMIELAGGEDVLGLPGERSRTAEWAELEAAAPDVIVSMPCGYYAEQAAAETIKQRERLAPLGARVFAVDAAAYFSRPGPRLVEGIELLAHLLHPELVPAPPTRRSIELDPSA